VLRAARPFQAGARTYPAGSYVIKTAQAFRPHIVDAFEPQDYPDDFAYPGGPPVRPYDVTGYTLAYQMGIRFDRVLEGLDGPFEKLKDLVRPPAGKITGEGRAGYLLSHESTTPSSPSIACSGRARKSTGWRSPSRPATVRSLQVPCTSLRALRLPAWCAAWPRRSGWISRPWTGSPPAVPCV